MTDVSLREHFLKMTLLLALAVVLATEALSLVHGITQVSLISWWGMVGVALGLYSWKRRNDYTVIFRQKMTVIWSKRGFWLYLTLFSTIITFVLALILPDNYYDSLTYHLARVTQWAQYKSVAHYATHNERQLFSQPFAEYAILHLQVLTGTNRFGNLVQWGAFIGCLVNVSLLTRQLTNRTEAQTIAVALVASIPMVLLQTPSAQNDVVTAFWITSFTVFTIEYARNPSIRSAVWVGLSMGLALLTKGTAYFFIPPLGLLFGWMIRKKLITFQARVWRDMLLIGVMAAGMNAGFFSRNYSLYGHVLGEASVGQQNELLTPAVAIINLERNLAMHLGIMAPKDGLRKALAAVVNKTYAWVGIQPNDPRLDYAGASFYMSRFSINQGNAQNFFYTLLLLVSLFYPHNYRNRQAIWLLVAAWGGLLLFSWLLRWQPWASRLHTSFFILTVPWVAIWLARRQWEWRVVQPFLLLSVGLHVLLNYHRPLVPIGWVARQVHFGNALPIPDYVIYKQPRAQAIMNGSSDVQRVGWPQVIKLIEQNNLRNVGLLTLNDDPEYVLYDHFNRGNALPVLFKHVAVTGPSSRLEDLTFQPDAVVATTAKVLDSQVVVRGDLYREVYANQTVKLLIRQSP